MKHQFQRSPRCVLLSHNPLARSEFIKGAKPQSRNGLVKRPFFVGGLPQLNTNIHYWPLFALFCPRLHLPIVLVAHV